MLARILTLTLTLSAAAPVAAEQVRFRYVPINPCGGMQQVPVGPEGAIGERRNGFGLVPQPFTETFRPTHMVTFRHPENGQNVTVPLTLPEGTPRVETRGYAIVYNYGSYVVEARFLPGGAVDTVYNSGFLRYLKVQ